MKCQNPNPFTEEAKVEIKKSAKNIKQLQEECKEYDITFRKADKKSVLEDKIKEYLRNKNDEDDE